MMKIINTGIIAVFCGIFFTGCNMDVNQSELAGVWKNNDGARIELREDGTYSAKKINYFYMYNENPFKDRKIDFSGHWEIVIKGNQNQKFVELHSNATYEDFGVDDTFIDKDGLKKSYKIGYSLEVSGHGIFGNKPPYDLSVNIGDPDNMEKYKFVKM